MQTTKQKVRRFYAFKVIEGKEVVYIATKPKIKLLNAEEPFMVMTGIVTDKECSRDDIVNGIPKKGNVYCTIKDTKFVCVDYWLCED